MSTSRSLLARLAGVGALAAASVTACSAQPASTAADAGLAQASVQASITWGACPALAKGATRDPREKCGTVTVPLNYRDPHGKQITVEVSEIATAKPGKFRGYLLLNPGGPGLEGLDMPGTMAPTLPASVLGQYDLIGFDPRGVGHSTPMSCGLSDAGLAAAFPYPAANGSITQNVTQARTVAADCAKIGDELQYFTTANTARDMDRIRAALGAKKISYWGQSYGTYLGAVYTALFPRRTDRMILEGDVDPNIVWSQQLKLWNKGMNQRFPDAAKVAAAANASLGLGSTAAQVTRTYIALARHLDTDPAAVPGASASINGSDLRNVTYELLLHNPTLTPLTQFWKAAADLSAGKALTATDMAVLQQVLAGTPAEPGVPADNQTTMTFALVCGDTSWARDVQSYAAATAAAQARYPLSDGMPDNIWPCAFWSKRPVEPTVKVTASGPRDILLLQNQRDNATPWAGALGLARALGSRAGFVGVDNGGHYVYGVGSTCADQATVAFLSQGTLPAKPLSCPAPPAS
jgi:pimeloyl-ACP methyl ester carboxylesterase